MAENDDQITGAGGPEAAEVQAQPDNVVTDNTGTVPVQPIATTDPTITDNTNPKVAFDGADPANIPPHDSNEQLHIAAGKRYEAEFGTSLTTDADTRRAAVDAAYDNSKDVRDVLTDDSDNDSSGRSGTRASAEQRAKAQSGNRVISPTGRAPAGGRQTTSSSKPKN